MIVFARFPHCRFPSLWLISPSLRSGSCDSMHSKFASCIHREMTIAIRCQMSEKVWKERCSPQWETKHNAHTWVLEVTHITCKMSLSPFGHLILEGTICGRIFETHKWRAFIIRSVKCELVTLMLQHICRSYASRICGHICVARSHFLLSPPTK